MKAHNPASKALAAATLLALVAALTACGGGSSDSAGSTTPTVDPTVSALSTLLPADAAGITTLPASLLPPDASTALDASLLPPS
ncbi:MAG: hypothetical protein RIQ60_546 [Pseudomonadota bacterium]|jgi:ABC-type oligopeptide transport system substrate-binding subunit